MLHSLRFQFALFFLPFIRLNRWRFILPLPKETKPKVKRDPKPIVITESALRVTADFDINERVADGVKPRSAAKGLTIAEWASAINEKPRNPIESNSKLKKTKFYQWSLPAHTATLVKDDKLVVHKTCPMADECAKFCYAAQGGYTFKSSMIAHTRNLQWVNNDPEGFVSEVTEAIRDKHSKGMLKAFRIHDAGDFYSRSYYMLWKQVIEALPSVQFYAYTKMVPMFEKLRSEGLIPRNFTIIYSFGGTHDHMIMENKHRHSKVFPTYRAMIEAGYWDTTETDLNASKPWKRKIGLVYHGADWAKGEACDKRVTLIGWLRYKWHQFLVWGEVKAPGHGE